MFEEFVMLSVSDINAPLKKICGEEEEKNVFLAQENSIKSKQWAKT